MTTLENKNRKAYRWNTDYNQKRIVYLVIAIIIIAISSYSCNGGRKKEYFTTSNMPLRQLVKSIENETTTTGRYFLISGSIDSEKRNVSKIKMYVLADGVYKYLEIDIRELLIRIDNKVNSPYLYVNYFTDSDDKLKNLEVIRNEYYTYNSTMVLVCPEKYLPEELLPITIK